MTKKNKVIFRLLGVFVVLLLVSLCLLGSTFARYTSSGSGKGTATVASWTITGPTSATAAVQFEATNGLTPNKAEYQSGQSGFITAPSASYGTSGYTSSGYRYHTTTLTEVATIANTGDVDASLTITVSTTNTIDYGSNSESNITAGTYYNNSNVETNFTATQVSDLFSLVLCDSNGNTYSSSSAVELTSGNSVVIYGYVVWTSHDDLNNTNDAEAADKLDTLVGQYVSSVSFSYTWTAVQGEELPAVQA